MRGFNRITILVPQVLAEQRLVMWVVITQLPGLPRDRPGRYSSYKSVVVCPEALHVLRYSLMRVLDDLVDKLVVTPACPDVTVL
jgi:hypothetical protein